MKQKLFYILLTIVTLATSERGLAQTTSYVLNKSAEVRLGTNSAGESLQLSGPGATLTFEAKKGSWATGGIHVQMSTDGGSSWGTDEYINSSLTTSYKTFTYSIATNVTHIRFKAQGTLYKYYQNVKITRATTLALAEGVSSTLDMGTIRSGKTTSNTIRVAFNNTTYNQTLTGTCTNQAFTVTSKSLGEKGEADITINFTAPSTAGVQTGTVTLNLNGATCSFTVTGTAAAKGTPSFTWNITHAFKNHTYSDFFVSTNTDTGYTIVSDNPSLGNVVGGKLVFFDGEGTVHFTVTQDGNDDWNLHSEIFTVTVTTAQNHLPLTITADNQASLVRSISGSYEYNSSGMRLGDGGGGLNWNDKVAEIVFEGIPDKITFDYEKQASGATDVDWDVRVSTDGNNWSTIWNVDNSGNGSADITVENPDVRYVRLCYSGNFGGYFNNINITERRYLTASKNTFDFGTNTKGNAVAPQTFTLSHCNAGYGVTFTSNDPSFAVSPNPVTTTGGDLMGTETITVTYLNNAVGVHSGTITISDPNGTNPDISLSVSGTTQTTYYTRAEAYAGTGGAAFVSFESSTAASAASVSRNSGVTTSTAASATAYWHAEPQEGYRFVEWQRADGTAASSNASYQWEGYTYDSEDAGNPTIVSLTAIFAPKELTLSPASPAYESGFYKTVTLSRTLRQGYSTIALPFATTVAALTGRTSADDWVAQLTTVTYNTQDGFTLYFTRTGAGDAPTGGNMAAGQPYVLHLGAEVVNPSWADLNVPAADAISVTPTTGYGTAASPDGSSAFSDWSMTSNFEAGFGMSGLYGIVNAQGGLQLGGSTSTLNAFSAFITPPAGNAGVKLRSAFIDSEGHADYIEGIPSAEAIPSAVYTLDGVRRQKTGHGIHLVRMPDGTVRKICL